MPAVHKHATAHAPAALNFSGNSRLLPVRCPTAQTNADIKRAPERDVASDTEKERGGSKRERELQRDKRTKMNRGCEEESERERKREAEVS
jgi:hypothetical protein